MFRMEESTATTTTFHVANELPGDRSSQVGVRRRISQESPNKSVDNSEAFKRLQRTFKDAPSKKRRKEGTVNSPVTDVKRKAATVKSPPPTLVDELRKISAINPPRDANNNMDGMCHSTPVDNKLNYCSGLGESPVDSGFGGWSEKDVENTAASSSFSSPPFKTWNMEAYFKPTNQKKRLYDSNEECRLFGQKLQDAIPLLVLAVVTFSSIVAVITLSNALRGQDLTTRSNGKYQSIEFAHAKHLDKAGTEDTTDHKIVDENGMKLGGKRAAIQFAHDLHQQQQLSDLVEEDVEEEEAFTAELDDEVVDALELVGNLQRQMSEGHKDNAMTSPEEQRERLLNQIASFGHFATSKASYENKMDDKEDLKVVPSRKKRNLKSKNKDPFRFYRRQSASAISQPRQEGGVGQITKLEDDPFPGFR